MIRAPGLLVILLLMAIALVLPAAASSSAPSNRGIAAPATVVQPSDASRAMGIAKLCRDGYAKTCNMASMVCGASCTTPGVIAPLAVVFVTIASSSPGNALPAKLDGHQGPPDPYPPRPFSAD